MVQHEDSLLEDRWGAYEHEECLSSATCRNCRPRESLSVESVE